MTLTAAQLTRRQQGLGASEIGAVLGLDPYRTPFDVWYAKVHPSEQSQVQTPAMARGHRLEPVVADMYAELHPGILLETGDTCQHPAHDWALATPDRLVLVPSQHNGLLEIKTKRQWTARGWGETGTQDVPLVVVAQVQWQLFVVDRPWADVALLIDGEEYREYHFERDDESIGAMVEAAQYFWAHHVLGQVAPELEGQRVASYLEQRFRQRSGELLSASEEAARWMWELDATNRAMKGLEADKERLTNRLKAAVGEAKGIVSEAGRFVWAEQKGGIDYKGLAESLGATAEQVEAYRRPSFRAARFTPAKGEG